MNPQIQWEETMKWLSNRACCEIMVLMKATFGELDDRYHYHDFVSCNDREDEMMKKVWRRLPSYSITYRDVMTKKRSLIIQKDKKSVRLHQIFVSFQMSLLWYFSNWWLSLIVFVLLLMLMLNHQKQQDSKHTNRYNIERKTTAVLERKMKEWRFLPRDSLSLSLMGRKEIVTLDLPFFLPESSWYFFFFAVKTTRQKAE